MDCERQGKVLFALYSEYKEEARQTQQRAGSRPTRRPPPSLKLCPTSLIVMDVANIAMHSGRNQTFRTEGIIACAQYWWDRGHRVVGFIPEHLLQPRAGNRLNVTLAEAAQLQDLVDCGVLIATPGQDYDDSYCIEYARRCQC
eukprot:c20524_g1_i2.p1 GENE.c20524_g1_i2~~c20524_g1_i2.p1  ORF type:complete len:143 (-),score=19.64 c20524_g1_i2:352-780(-)